MRYIALLIMLICAGIVYAAPDTLMSISPAATDATVIEASDENDRNNDISTAYNAHTHTDISQTGNTLNIGDGAAGTKTITAYNADTNKPYVRFNDTSNIWQASRDGVNIESVALMTAGAAAIGKAVCWNGTILGYCTDQPGATGSCTCE